MNSQVSSHLNTLDSLKISSDASTHQLRLPVETVMNIVVVDMMKR